MTWLTWDRTARTSRWLLTVAAAVYVASVYLRPTPGHSAIWDDVFANVVLWAAGGVCLLGAWRGRQPRAAILLLASAVLIYAVGSTFWSVWVQPLAEQPYPSVADYFWLTFYPLGIPAILLMARGHTGRGWLAWIDGVSGALAVAAVGTLISLDPIAHNVTGSTAAIVVNMAYPIGDLCLLMLLITLTAASRRRPSGAWLLLGACLAVWAVADTTYVFQVAAGTYVAGSALEAGWLVPIVGMAWIPWIGRKDSGAQAVGAAAVGEAAGREAAGQEAAGQEAAAREAAAREAAAREVSALRRPRIALVLPTALAALCLGLLTWKATAQAPVFAALAAAALGVSGFRLVLSVREVERLAVVESEARTDSLTGLGNRRRLTEVLRERMATGDGFALLLLDLDGFKDVNDAHGHQAGDRCLTIVAQRMLACIRADDALFRLGGDEFAIICATGPDDGHAPLVERLVHEIARPMAIGDVDVSVGASIGMVTCPDQVQDAAEALRCADIAMYHAKRNGLGCVAFESALDVIGRNRLATVGQPPP